MAKIYKYRDINAADGQDFVPADFVLKPDDVVFVSEHDTCKIITIRQDCNDGELKESIGKLSFINNNVVRNIVANAAKEAVKTQQIVEFEGSKSIPRITARFTKISNAQNSYITVRLFN